MKDVAGKEETQNCNQLAAQIKELIIICYSAPLSCFLRHLTLPNKQSGEEKVSWTSITIGRHPFKSSELLESSYISSEVIEAALNFFILHLNFANFLKDSTIFLKLVELFLIVRFLPRIYGTFCSELLRTFLKILYLP